MYPWGCLKCICYQWGPYNVKAMGSLPKSKVIMSPPFINNGIDYFGCSLHNWVCLFTCITTYVVHLELIENMSLKRFLEGLRRFLTRRWQTTSKWVRKRFTRFRKILSMAHKYTVILLKKRIKWSSTSEHSPWKRGFFEKLIEKTKKDWRGRFEDCAWCKHNYKSL